MEDQTPRKDGQKLEERRRRITTIRDKKGMQRQDRRGGATDIRKCESQRKTTITTIRRKEGRKEDKMGKEGLKTRH